jgi:hypothetical protein
MDAIEGSKPATKSNGTLEQQTEQAALNAEVYSYDCLLGMLFGLGCLLMDTGDAAGAEAQYRDLLSIEPAHVAAHYSLGLLLNAKGDALGAEAEFRAAVARNPAALSVEPSPRIAGETSSIEPSPRIAGGVLSVEPSPRIAGGSPAAPAAPAADLQ